MEALARSEYPDGYAPPTRRSLRLVKKTKTSSTPPASRCTGKHWQRADLLPNDEWNPAPPVEVKTFHWDFFPTWHDDAKCRSAENPDDTFFGESEDDTRTTMTVSKLREVKAFCQSCPVWETCLRHSLTKPERHGIWAGTSKRTRLRILSMLDSGLVTIDIVVEDYKAGREKKYESIRHPQ